MPKYLTISIIIGSVIVGVISIGYIFQKTPTISTNTQCQAKEMIFYYLDTCSWCNKVKDEGTISKIKQLGVNVKEINTVVGPIRHQFQGVPTFVINNKVYSGYKTFDELKELLGCPTDGEQVLGTKNQTPSPVQIPKAFLGENGEKVVLENGEVKLDAAQFNNNKARFYNIEMPSGKIVHFFVVKDKKGIYRAAADACQVCYGQRKGFRQDGDEIVCNNCGNRYPIEKIATEKGGCNPGPINPNLKVENGKITIKQVDIGQVSDLF